MAAFSQPDPRLEAQCRRIAAWSIALERRAGGSTHRVNEYLDLAEALDAHFGWEPFGGPGEEPEQIAEIALACLRVVPPEDIDHAIERLPVFPLAAQRALGVMLRDDWNAWELESIAGSDQALAANLLRAANSWAHAPRQRIHTIPHAITYIGAERTSRILYAAAIQPMFATPRLRDLWHHSVASAEVAQNLAEVSRAAEPKKAFLAGLVHDIGSLAMAALAPAFQDLFRRLTDLGCEPILAERALSGVSHAQAGARALKLWKFEPEFCEAVEFHHAPEQTENRLASLLYLTEQWTDASEDPPSALRFRVALDRVGITERQFEELSPLSDRMMAAL
jgi:putative nucleotidyltransferase with HDIG domain